MTSGDEGQGGGELPHRRLVAYGVALELLCVVREARIRRYGLRDQAERAAISVVLNVAGGAGRVSRDDKRRAYAIARGEALEVAAAIEAAVVLGVTSRASLDRALPLTARLHALLSGLLR